MEDETEEVKAALKAIEAAFGVQILEMGGGLTVNSKALADAVDRLILERIAEAIERMADRVEEGLGVRP